MKSISSGKWPKAGSARGERRRRTIYSKEQVAVLAKAFEEQPYPGYHARERLAQQIGVLEPRIHVWFQNRRARQPKRANPARSIRKRNSARSMGLAQATGTVEFPPAPVRGLRNDSRPRGGNWSLPGQQQAFEGGSQEAALAAQGSLPVGPNSVDWVSSVPSDSGPLPTFPQPSHQHNHLQNPVQIHSYDPYQQQPSQNPQLGDNFSSSSHCVYPNPAVDLHGVPDLIEHLYLAQAAMNEAQMSQAGLYGNETESWENWR